MQRIGLPGSALVRRATNAMAAGLTERVWDMADVVALIERVEMDAMAETIVR